ncbi:MAG TPA: PKD domain-containing protein [Methanotrichaceae archaeon]|nr:PKD domain-containing protein [Methanotrichaceae archaeon]
MKLAEMVVLYGMKRFLGAFMIVSCSLMLSVFFISPAFGLSNPVENDADGISSALSGAESNIVKGDIALSHPDTSPSANAFTISQSGPMNESNVTKDSYDSGDQVKYIFDWGDGTTSETGFVESGVNVSISHNWSSEGVYYVKVRAVDTHEASSSWSDPMEVTIVPRIKRVSSSHR